MLKNYLTIALRNLLKYKGYSLINIAGLAIGMACFVLISLFVRIELSYDTFHEKADRIYRVVKEDPGNFYMGTNYFAVTPVPLAPALVAEFPEIIQATRIDNMMNNLIGNGEFKAYEDGIWADAHFFDVFTFPLIQGDPKTALAEPNTTVLSVSMARKYFGDEDPMGKTMLFRNEKTLQVTGVMEDPPVNSHFTFEYIVSLLTNDQFNRDTDRWNNNSFYTYFVLAEGHTIEEVRAKLPAFTKTHLTDSYRKNPEQISRYYIQPLTDIHLRSHTNFEIGRNGDIKYVYMFSGIAMVILLIACVNYMNLATARSATRAREVGVRKVVGAYRLQLIAQFTGESVILSLIAVMLTGVVVLLLLSTFNTLVERTITVDAIQNAPFLLGLIGVGLLVGIVSGSYPALVLSGTRPASIIRETTPRGTKQAVLRNVLVVGQFAVTIILIIGTIVIDRQLTFMRTAETGINREHVVVVPMRDPDARKQYETIRQELLSNPDVLMVSTSSSLPTRVSSQTSLNEWEGKEGNQRVPIYIAAVNYDYIEMFGIELVEGRSFSKEYTTDSQGAILLNETAIRQMGWDTAVGKQLKFWGSDSGIVVGVIKDFHFNSFHHQIEPLLLYINPTQLSNMLVKIRSQDIPETIAYLERTMQTFSPDYPFEYEFLDDAFNSMYRTEQTLGQIFGYFTGIALVIASLGLFGLAAFMAEQRTREIGIRKVLGASIPDILWLLSRDFTLLVVIAFTVGAPVAYYAMRQWLQDFAYRIELGAGIFALAGLLSLLIALITVSYQSMNAARENPVQSLRYE